jgi:hypothetical protein
MALSSSLRRFSSSRRFFSASLMRFSRSSSSNTSINFQRGTLIDGLGGGRLFKLRNGISLSCPCVVDHLLIIKEDQKWVTAGGMLIVFTSEKDSIARVLPVRNKKQIKYLLVSREERRERPGVATFAGLEGASRSSVASVVLEGPLPVPARDQDRKTIKTSKNRRDQIFNIKVGCWGLLLLEKREECVQTTSAAAPRCSRLRRSSSSFFFLRASSAFTSEDFSAFHVKCTPGR